MDFRIKKSQKNELFEAIEFADFAPSTFEFSSQSTTYGQTYHIASPDPDYYFEFFYHNGSIKCRLVPSLNWNQEELLADSWGEVLEAFNQWLEALQEEISIEDKWELIYTVQQFIIGTDSSNIGNERFTVPEFEDVSIRFDIVKTEIRNISLAPEQLKLIDTKLDQVLNLAKSMGKNDWRNQVVGAVISLIITLSVSQEQGRMIWEIIKRVFNAFFLPASN